MNSFDFSYKILVKNGLTLQYGNFATKSKFDGSDWAHYRVLELNQDYGTKSFSDEAMLLKSLIQYDKVAVFPMSLLGQPIGTAEGSIYPLMINYAGYIAGEPSEKS